MKGFFQSNVLAENLEDSQDDSSLESEAALGGPKIVIIPSKE
jgi:hypothetical protein